MNGSVDSLQLDLNSSIIHAKELAVARIQQAFKQPDDLILKLANFRKKIISERQSTEAQLKTLVERQLDDIQNGMQSIQIIKEDTNDIKNNLRNIDKLCYETSNSITNYSKIMKVIFLFFSWENPIKCNVL
jgi:ketol-acid reductoisomerase